MSHFMSEEEAIAIIEERVEEIVAKMASGNSSTSRTFATNYSPSGPGAPCNGECAAPGTSECCNCCVC